MFKKGARKQDEPVNQSSDDETLQASTDHIKIEFKKDKKGKKNQDEVVIEKKKTVE